MPMDPTRAYNYMTALARALADADDEPSFSLAWYYEHYLAQDLERPELAALRHLMGTELEEVRHPEPPSAELVADVDRALAADYPISGAHPLNDAQRMAVYKALTYPLSIIKGPPGTGKTEVIVRMVALAVERGWRVAVVSTNRAAVSNVVEKVQAAVARGGADGPAQDLVCRLGRRMATLGNASVRKHAVSPVTGRPFGFASGPNAQGVSGWEKRLGMVEFCAQYPAVTSTIHSIKKCFADGASAKYDLLVMDEASQTNLVAGMLAVSCATHVCVVGDEQQLEPIVNVSPAAEEGLLEHVGQPTHDALSHGDYAALDWTNSLLECCYLRLGIDPEALEANVLGLPLTMLDEHYRCHPKIIGFCSEAFYGSRLKIRTAQPANPADRVPVPIRVRWYEGDYAEPHWCREEKDGKTSWHSSKINWRQIKIMRDHEFAHIAELVSGWEGEPRSVCVLSPYKGVVDTLQKELNDYLADLGVNDRAEVRNLGDAGEGGRADQMALTIHKSQGQEFDCVYLLPVEDSDWEWPWSQGRRIVNVAVSRAKRELVVVASTLMMSHELQEKLTGHAAERVDAPSSEEHDPDRQWMFVRKLMDYVDREIGALPDAERSHNADLGFGFFAPTARERSVFDRTPAYRLALLEERRALSRAMGTNEEDAVAEALQESADGRRTSDSAPELCVLEQLPRIPGCKVLRGVKFSMVTDARGNTLADALARSDNAQTPVLRDPGHFEFDFAVVEEGTGCLLVALEVDGAFHRYKKRYATVDGVRVAMPDFTVQEHDRCKDRAMRAGCEALCLSSDRGLSRRRRAGSFAFLRMPTSGTSQNEVELIRRLVRLQLEARSADAWTVCQEDLPRTISMCVREWKQDPALADIARTPVTMNAWLVEQGILCDVQLEDGQRPIKLPTARGVDLGVRVIHGFTDGRLYATPVYDRGAQEKIAELMRRAGE